MNHSTKKAIEAAAFLRALASKHYDVLHDDPAAIIAAELRNIVSYVAMLPDMTEMSAAETKLTREDRVEICRMVDRIVAIADVLDDQRRRS